MADRLKIGVVGVGAIGKNHARVLAEIPEADLTVVCDASPEAAAAIAAAYGCRAVSRVEDLLPLVDAVTIATPTITHRQVGELCLNAGKHVLIEKPIADTVDDARFLVELAQAKERVLQVGHIERFNPILAKLEERMKAPRFIEAHRLSPFPNRSTDIGVVLDLMIHDLEIILYLVDSPIVSIDSVGVPVLTKREDIANARLRFANGCVANITASRISPEKLRKIRVFCADCYLSLDYQEQNGQLFQKSGLSITREEVAVERDEPLKLELASFVRCSQLGLAPRVSGRAASAALALALKITEQIQKANQTDNSGLVPADALVEVAAT